MLTTVTLAAALLATRVCPATATATLPELVGQWEVLAIGGMDRARPDSMRADATIAPELQDCLLQERLVARAGSPPYEAVALWGVNGADSTVQRTFAHSQHGRFAVYQGRRVERGIALRQMPVVNQSNRVVVVHHVEIADRDHFSITSRLSNDDGATWRTLSRSEYRRAARGSPGG